MRLKGSVIKVESLQCDAPFLVRQTRASNNWPAPRMARAGDGSMVDRMVSGTHLRRQEMQGTIEDRRSNKQQTTSSNNNNKHQ